MLNRKKKIEWNKGYGELLGFAIILPFLVAFIFFVISMAQVITAEQDLTYAVYRGGRAAVISYNYEDACDAMKNELVRIFGESSVSSGIGTSSDVVYQIGASGKIDNSDWQKGNVITISVSKKVNTLLPMMAGIRTRVTAMMIEHSYWSDNVKKNK